jgi:hypothetical protein
MSEGTTPQENFQTYTRTYTVPKVSRANMVDGDDTGLIPVEPLQICSCLCGSSSGAGSGSGS